MTSYSWSVTPEVPGYGWNRASVLTFPSMSRDTFWVEMKQILPDPRQKVKKKENEEV